MAQRKDLKNNVTQSFCYDGLNRIKAARFNGCSSAANDYAYDLFGNIKTKQGVTGIFGYGTKNTGIGSQLAGPHAVTQANGYTYQYDRNGNLTTATKTGASTKSVVYSPFNTPTSITEGSKWSNIIYGPNQDRIKHSDSNGRVTKYVGGLYEEVTHNGVTQKIHYVGDQILFVQKSTSPSESYQYLHRDHIGSIVAITGSEVSTQADVQYLANGVWGERRFQQWNGPLDDNFVPTGTARGFTDHEHLDSVGLIHMNGRVYDQELGRFLSADPLIQAPHNTQSYNRYSYVFNNPLSFVDPSGFATEDPCEKVDCQTVTGPSSAEIEAQRQRDAMLNSYIQSLMQESNINQMIDMYNTTREMQRLNQTLRHQSILGLSTKGTLNQINSLSGKKGGWRSYFDFSSAVGFELTTPSIPEAIKKLLGLDPSAPNQFTMSLALAGQPFFHPDGMGVDLFFDLGASYKIIPSVGVGKLTFDADIRKGHMYDRMSHLGSVDMTLIRGGMGVVVGKNGEIVGMSANYGYGLSANTDYTLYSTSAGKLLNDTINYFE